MEVGGTTVRYADTLGATGPSVRPSVSVEWPRAAAGVSGSYTRLESASFGEAAAYGSIFTPQVGRVAGELGGVAGGSTHQAGFHTGQAAASLRVHLLASDMGAWLGAGAGRAWDGAVQRRMRMQELGGWLRLPSQTLLASVMPTSLGDTLQYTDLQLSARHHAPSLDVDASFGFRAGDRLPEIGGAARRWGTASLTMWIRSAVALVMGAGTYPADIGRGFPGGRFGSLGVRISTEREASPDIELRQPFILAEEDASFAVVSRNDERVFRVRAARARTIEIAGDFSGWKAVALARAEDGTWVATLSIPAGAYQMNVRIDGGEWTLPSGLPVVRDEFGGTAGLLVLE